MVADYTTYKDLHVTVLTVGRYCTTFSRLPLHFASWPWPLVIYPLVSFKPSQLLHTAMLYIYHTITFFRRSNFHTTESFCTCTALYCISGTHTYSNTLHIWSWTHDNFELELHVYIPTWYSTTTRLRVPLCRDILVLWTVLWTRRIPPDVLPQEYVWFTRLQTSYEVKGHTWNDPVPTKSPCSRSASLRTVLLCFLTLFS